MILIVTTPAAAQIGNALVQAVSNLRRHTEAIVRANTALLDQMSQGYRPDSISHQLTTDATEAYAKYTVLLGVARPTLNTDQVEAACSWTDTPYFEYVAPVL